MAAFPSNSAVIQRLGEHYEILAPIGRPFGYQQVLAKGLGPMQDRVIKSLTIEENTPTGDICCFEREIHLLESLTHPTIPRYIDSFTVDAAHSAGSQGSRGQSISKGLVLVQSHNGGQTLEQHVAIGRVFSESDIKAIAKQLLQGLIYLHKKGLVHRDIRPSNVVVTGHDAELGQAMWLNLGTVQYVQAQRQDSLVGTYGYMPTEQVGGQATFASDLYSLGATLIYLATGQHLGQLPQRIDGDMSFGSARLSSNFQQWLGWLIEPCAGDRPQSAKKALSALNHLPFAMVTRRLKRAKKLDILPIPINSSSREQSQPFFTKIKSRRQEDQLELTVPPVGMRSPYVQKAVVPLAIGSTLLCGGLYLIALLKYSFSLAGSLAEVATLIAAILGTGGCVYSLAFLKCGFRLLGKGLFRQVQIQVLDDILLIAYKYWFRAPDYVVNTKRQDIYNISVLPDGSTLRILTHNNRTQSPRDCYKLSLGDAALSHRDIRWLHSLLGSWQRHSHPCQ